MKTLLFLCFALVALQVVSAQSGACDGKCPFENYKVPVCGITKAATCYRLFPSLCDLMEHNCQNTEEFIALDQFICRLPVPKCEK